MTIPLEAIDPDAQHREWVRRFEWHLDLVPVVMEQLVTATIPTIPVSRGGSQFDRPQITGGGYADNMALLDGFTLTEDGRFESTGAVSHARELWRWVVSFTRAAAEWIGEPAPLLADEPNADPLLARGAALTTVGWLIGHEDAIGEVRELDESCDAMFALIRRLRGVYGVFQTPRRPRGHVCTVCGLRTVHVSWVDGPGGSPKPVQVARCRNCGQTYEETAA